MLLLKHNIVVASEPLLAPPPPLPPKPNTSPPGSLFKQTVPKTLSSTTPPCRYSGYRQRPNNTATAVRSAKFGGFSIGSVFKRCETCAGQGAIECPGCKGTGKNKKNGNIFERWKCFECQGFGLKSCPECGRGGLTPEQRGER